MGLKSFLRKLISRDISVNVTFQVIFQKNIPRENKVEKNNKVHSEMI